MSTSAICPIDGSRGATSAALREADRFAKETGLTGKQALHLRLLTEELLGVLNGVTEVKDGSFVIEQENEEYRLRLSARTFPVGETAQQRLLGASSSGENAFYQGVVGKLRMVADWYSKGARQADQDVYVGAGFASHIPEEWSLVRMRNRLAREKKAAQWDELEASILLRLADDVRIGLRSERIAITVFKTFKAKAPENN